MKKEINVNKAIIYSVAVNSVQICAAFALAVFLISDASISQFAKGAVILLTVFVSLGAAVDIQEALSSRKVLIRMSATDEIVAQMEELNRKLRIQRHDFLNHLQVVYSLIEMKEFADASDYIEKIYGDTQTVSRVMRTGNPAINALLNAKLTACEQAGIKVETDLGGEWKNLPLPVWEICRILSNLIDNAFEALENVGDKQLSIMLREDIRGFRYAISNNGPMIPSAMREKIFEAGVSSKGEGRGMGLHIVKRTLSECGGEISLESSAVRTTFSGFLPRAG